MISRRATVLGAAGSGVAGAGREGLLTVCNGAFGDTIGHEWWRDAFGG